MIVTGTIIAAAIALLIWTDSEPTGPPSCVPDCIRAQTKLGMSEPDARTSCRESCRSIAVDRELRGAPR
jgi:hypothetical protein